MGLRDNPPGLIQTGEITQRLIKAFGIRGKTTAPRLGDQVHPVVLVADLVHGGVRESVTVRPCAGTAVVTSGAGNTPKIAVRVVEESTILAIDAVICSVTTAILVQIGTTGASLANFVANLQYLDARLAWNTNPTPPIQLRSEDSVTTPFGNAFVSFNLPTNTPYTVPFPYPVIVTSPNSLVVESTALATALRVSFIGREIQLL